jgi:signal transduction histidine kinase
VNGYIGCRSSTPGRYSTGGLGLALSRKFIEMHGGRTWVKSEVGMARRSCLRLGCPGGLRRDMRRRTFLHRVVVSALTVNHARAWAQGATPSLLSEGQGVVAAQEL